MEPSKSPTAISDAASQVTQNVAHVAACVRDGSSLAEDALDELHSSLVRFGEIVSGDAYAKDAPPGVHQRWEALDNRLRVAMRVGPLRSFKEGGITREDLRELERLGLYSVLSPDDMTDIGRAVAEYGSARS